MPQLTTVKFGAVIETDPGGSLIVTVDADGTFYRIPLADLTPAFDPVDPADAVTGPVEFTPEMEAAFTRMEENGSCGPDIFAYQPFEGAVLMLFYRQAYSLPEGTSLRFDDANNRAIEDSGNYPTTAADVIPAVKYHWEKAAAVAWRLLKQQLGQ